jgi:hypothetical protein
MEKPQGTKLREGALIYIPEFLLLSGVELCGDMKMNILTFEAEESVFGHSAHEIWVVDIDGIDIAASRKPP